MKQLYTLTLALIVGASVFGQTKPDTTKKTYTITIPMNDYQTLVQHMAQSKQWIPYAPGMTDAQKMEFLKGVDGYLQALPNRVKVDSTKSTVKKPK